MICLNHPDRETTSYCGSCARPFCGHCLVPIGAEYYCADCKVFAIEESYYLTEEATNPSTAAGEAIKAAVFSIFCFGFLLGPFAVIRGFQARREIHNATYTRGSGVALAAIIIGSIAAILWVVNLASMVYGFGQS